VFEEVIFAFGNFQLIEVMGILDKRRREIIKTLNIIDMVHELINWFCEGQFDENNLC
jgi:hypothetical protein